MPITRSSHNDHLIVSIRGRMDARFIQAQRENLETLPSEVKDVILFDLSKTDFIDSSGIGFLVYIFKRIKPQKFQMAIIGMNGQPKDIIEMLKINRLIDCVDSVSKFVDGTDTAKRGSKLLGGKKIYRQRVEIKRNSHA